MGEFALQHINKERRENERVNETEMERGRCGREKVAEGDRKREGERGKGRERGWDEE